MGVSIGNLLFGGGTITIDGTDVGFTRGGLSIKKTTTHHFVDKVDQATGKVKAFVADENYTVKFNMLEVTLAQLRVAWDEKSVITAGALPIGGNPADQVTEHNLVFSGVGPNGGTRVVELYKVVFTDRGDQIQNKDGETMIAITGECLVDTGYAEGEQIGEITDGV